MPYSVPKDFSFIARVAEVPYAVHVNQGQPFRTLQELLAYAKANPDRLRYGSAGEGSLPHVAMEMLSTQAGVKMLHVPYRGMAAVTNDLVAGHIDAAVVSPPTMVPHVASGKVRTLALMAPRRAAQWPQTPSTAESGSVGVEAELAFALAGPAGMDPDIVARLAREVEAVLKDPAIARTLAERGFNVAYLDPTALLTQIRLQTRKWAAVVEKSRITAE
jgi:tripartite-type tricarboxylate transporter receptor subunit TctC